MCLEPWPCPIETLNEFENIGTSAQIAEKFAKKKSPTQMGKNQLAEPFGLKLEKVFVVNLPG